MLLEIIYWYNLLPKGSDFDASGDLKQINTFQ